ncbi:MULTISPECIES: lipopolysaccharide biosynthesis protein [Aequorivita]|uniref:Lipopolysaccharide biosynthesis protein n=1 Tax=Aequorivita iocasae TaxID=2803865 RepID=A0ABX7DQX9_9FLAO|nr:MULTISPECIES: lipopolysaccharide biosynthesis protein [Aequorivita]QQX75953.1 lipopolysaccharide biosynthesis protein [Aequorivita iocasae]UCA55414.1 lipopolysaccharide biosynthesis protein [Aequorivita sp. F7]
MSLRQQAINGVIWTFAQQFSVQIINFGMQIVLARLLMPEMFGLIAMINIFISIGQLLMDGGMTTSLIRTKNSDNKDYSTVFMTNLSVSIFVYLIVFACAPLIADFYDQAILTEIVRVFALMFVINAFSAVHVAKLTKEMNFKKQMTFQIPSTVIGAITGVTLALLGYGVWSLVWLNLAQVTALSLQYWLMTDWRPSFIIDKSKLKYHFNFGYKMTLSGLLDRIYNNAYNIVIGKFFSPAQVGFFYQAESMRLFPVNQIGSVLGKVTYPMFAKIETDKELKNACKKTMKLVLSVAIPVMFILILVADDLFLLVFGEKWMPAVPYFKILAIASIVRPISGYNLNILKVKGRSDLFLKVEVIKKILGVAAIAIALPFGIMPLVISLTVVSYLFVMVNMIVSGRLINYKVYEQLKDISLLYCIGFVVTVICYFILPYMSTNILIVNLLIGAIFYGATYVLLLFLFERQVIHLIIGLLKK